RAYLGLLQRDFTRFRDEFAVLGKHVGHAQASYLAADRRLEQFGQKFVVADGNQRELFDDDGLPERKKSSVQQRGGHVRLSLFSRLTIGYLVIFLVVAMASASAVLELRYFRDLTDASLNIDKRMLDHEKMLADSVLAQSRAEQKFIITRDETWYQQFV